MVPDTRDRATQVQEAELRERLHALNYQLRRSPVRSSPPGLRTLLPRHIVVTGYDPFDFAMDLDGVADWLKTTAGR